MGTFKRSALLAWLSTGLLVGCDRSPTGSSIGPDDAPAPAGARLDIVDAAHGSAVQGFYFLPPLVEQPNPVGVFDATLLDRLTVEVCRIGPGATCEQPPLRTFTSEGATAYERIRVVPAREYYNVYWNTAGSDPADHYRVTVLLDGAELGHVDVDVVAAASQLEDVDRSAFAGVVAGGWLPIPFRVEEGAEGSNEPPTVEISSPLHGATFDPGEEIQFTGSGNDPEDGPLTGAALVWSSSQDGEIGTGESFTKDDLSNGTHVITLTGTDSDGAAGTDEITIRIGSVPMPGDMICGTLVAASIDAAGEIDQYTFSGEAGAIVTLTLVQTGGFPIGSSVSNARATLFSPAGTPMITFDSNGQVDVTLTETGTHTIRVQAENPAQTGSYSVGLECILPTNPIDDVLDYGDLLARTIEAPGEVDQYTFTGEAGGIVTLTLVQTGGFPVGSSVTNARATLFSPAGAQMLFFDSNGQQDVTLPETGTYIIQIQAESLFHTGSYSLGLESLLPTNPVDEVLAYGDLLDRTIEAPGEVDQYTFSGQAGGIVTLTLVQTGGFPVGSSVTNARATLFSPAGVQLLVFDSNGQQDVTLPETGTYIIQIQAETLFHTGSYSLGLEGLLPTNPVDEVLTYGDLLARTIESAGEVDQYTFSGQAGGVVTLTLVQTGGFPVGSSVTNARATLFSPAGAQLLVFDSNGQQDVTLPETGTYIIQIQAETLFHTGSYSIGLEGLAPTNPVDQVLAYGNLLDRTIEAPGEVDQYTFSGQAGGIVTLTLVQTGGFPVGSSVTNARATLFSPAGVQLLVFDSNGQQDVTLPETGTYIIQVQAETLFHTGSYSIGLEGLAPTNPVNEVLAYGDLLARTIESAGEVDQYTFSGDAGEVVTLTLVQTGGFPVGSSVTNARATLFSPAGAPLLVFDSNRQQDVTLPETGTYIIQVQAETLFHTGSYNIGITQLP